MIRALRDWHLRIFAVLALLVPLLLILALAARAPVPPVEHLPAVDLEEAAP